MGCRVFAPELTEHDGGRFDVKLRITHVTVKTEEKEGVNVIRIVVVADRAVRLTDRRSAACANLAQRLLAPRFT